MVSSEKNRNFVNRHTNKCCLSYVVGTILLLTLLFTGLQCHGQDTVKTSLFFSANEFNNNNATFNSSITIRHRSVSDIRWNGGNDYKVVTNKSVLKKRKIKFALFAITKGDSLFFNGWKLGLGLWYSYALTLGRYICLEAGVPGSFRLAKDLRKAGLYRPTGGLLTLGYPFQNNIKRFLYVYDTKLNTVSILDEINLINIIDTEPDLIQSFKNEPVKDKVAFIKYVGQINNRIK